MSLGTEGQPAHRESSIKAGLIEKPAQRRAKAVRMAPALLALFVLGACTKVGPDFVAPEAPVQDAWVGETEEEVLTESTDLSTWWQVFDDPILTQLVSSAFQQNLTLQAAGLRVIEARAELGIAIGEQFPQTQDGVGSYAYNRVSKNAANQKPNDRVYEDLVVGLDASWELDFWGKFARAIESSDAFLGARIADYEDFLVILTADVALAYVIVREAEERIRLARENTDIQAQSLQLAQDRFIRGAVTELDVQRARALLTETQSSIPFFQIQRRQGQNALAVLLGVPPTQIVSLLRDEGAIPTAPEEVAIGIPAELLRRRPDIRRAELEAAAQSAQIGVARAQLFPAFTLGGFVGFEVSNANRNSNNATLSEIFTRNSFTGFVGPSFSWPILNYGRLTNNVRVQDARLQGLIADYQNTVLEAYREVEDGLVGFARSREQTGFLTTSVRATRRAVELALLQYRAGAIDYTPVLDTQEDLVERQDALAVAQSSIAQNLILAYRGLGGGWEIRQPNEFVPPETIDTMRDRTDWGRILPASDIEDAPDSGPAAADTDTYFRRPDF